MSNRYRLILLTTMGLTTIAITGSVADSATQSTVARTAHEPYIVLAQAPTKQQLQQQQQQQQQQQNQQKQQSQQKGSGPPQQPAHINPPNTGQKFVAPGGSGPPSGQRFNQQSGAAPNSGAKVVTPSGHPNFFNPNANQQRTFGPGGNAGKAAAIRNANRAIIGNQNFSVRRSSYRVYRGGRWMTFAGLGTLSALMFGGALYYPYAYIDAPPEFCEGFTEDGCQLHWQEVQTIEGYLDFQCVAYCPWR